MLHVIRLLCMQHEHKKISNGSLVRLYGGYKQLDAFALVLGYMGKNTKPARKEWSYEAEGLRWTTEAANHTYRVRLLSEFTTWCGDEYAHTNPGSEVFLRIVEVLVEA